MNARSRYESNACDLATFTDFVFDLCHQNYFADLQNIDILHNLKKLKDFWEYFGHYDHPSIPKILNDIGNILAGTHSSQLALPFFMEQLRIETYYLGDFHPDLAFSLFNIGQVYEKIGQLMEAKEYFTKAMCLLRSNKRKGRLHAKVMYKLGLVYYRQSSYRDAVEYFNLAIAEHQAEYEEYHPIVAEVYMKVGEVQLETGKLQDAMNNFLKALMIIRIIFGNNDSKAAECLYQIGLIHEARNEFKESLNALHQALAVNENGEVKQISEFPGNIKTDKFCEKTLLEMHNTYTPKLLEILKELAPEKVKDYHCSLMIFTLSPKDSRYGLHTDNKDKLLSTVIYLKPENNTGTILYEHKEDKYPQTVEWKQNRALIFSRTDETWHSYKGDGINDRYALVYNLMSKK